MIHVRDITETHSSYSVIILKYKFKKNRTIGIPNKKDFKIIETSLERFLLGDQLEIEEPYNSKFDRDEVVQRAKNYANSHLFRQKYYNFVSNNCEHFARYCYDGKAESEQVVAGTTVVVAAGTLLAGAIAGKLIANRRKKIEQKKDK